MKLSQIPSTYNTIKKSIFKGSLKNYTCNLQHDSRVGFDSATWENKCNWPTDCLVCLVHTTYYPTCLHSLYVLQVWLAMAFGCRSRLVEKDDSFFLYSQMNYLQWFWSLALQIMSEFWFVTIFVGFCAPINKTSYRMCFRMWFDNNFGPFWSRYCWILTGIWLIKIKIDT